MPYLTVSTNSEIPAETAQLFLREASQAVATGTKKPEQYVMVKLEAARPMLFGGSDEPVAFLELKSIGFPTSGVEAIAAALSGLTSKHLGIRADRVFVVFQDVRAPMWGQGGEMFG